MMNSERTSAAPRSTPVHPPRLELLTFSRFLAAALVMWAHFHHFGLLGMPTSLASRIQGGAPSVTFFFVLSGFILQLRYGHQAQSLRLRDYFEARFFRIFPSMWAAVGISALAVWLTQRTGDGPFAPWPAPGPATFVPLLSTLTGTTAWFPFSAVQAVFNPPLWSIACEILFYLCFPVILRAGASGRTRALYWFFGFAISTQFATAIILSALEGSNRTQLLLHRFPLLHLAEFIWGYLAARCFQNLRFRTPVATAAAGFAVTIAVLVVCVAPSGPQFLVLGPCFAVVVYWLASASGRVHVPKSLVVLGDASYLIYLLHWPIAQLHAGLDLWPTRGDLIVAEVLLFSVIVHKWFEVPILHVAKQRARRRHANRAA